MKKTMILLFLSCSLLSFAQVNQGTIIYEESVKLDIDLPQGMQLPEGFPDAQVSKNVLYFKGNESTYKPYDDAGSVEFSQTSESEDFSFKIDRPEYYLYKQLSKNQKSELRDLFGKRFIVNDQLKDFQWKLGNDSKEILGYKCSSALLKDSTGTTIVWYTNEIPVSNGPANFGKLPGLILEVNIDNGQRSIRAVEVNLKETKTEEITKPTKGKSVTQAQFDEITEKKMKEIGATRGEGGMIKMIVTEEN